MDVDSGALADLVVAGVLGNKLLHVEMVGLPVKLVLGNLEPPPELVPLELVPPELVSASHSLVQFQSYKKEH